MGQLARGGPGPLAVLIGAVILVLAAVVVAEHRYVSHSFDDAHTWSRASGELRAHLSESHLWLEERLGGDRSVDVDRQVLGNIDVALGYCRALVEGGRVAFEVQQVPAGAPRETTARVCRSIRSLRAGAIARLESGADDVGPRVDEAYDAAFSSALSLSRRGERLRGTHLQRRRSLADRVNAVTIAVLLLLLGAIVVLIRRHQRRLDRLARRNQSILDAAGDGIYGLDREGRITFVNPAAARMTGRDADELLGRSLYEMVDRLDQDVFRRADGTSFPVERTSTPIVEDGEVSGAVLVVKDVTERKRAEDELAASERQTRQILETAHDAFISIDERGLITDCNPRAQETFGWACDEMLGRELAELIVPARYREAHRRGIAHFLASGEAPVLDRRLELAALHRDGREFPVELTISALRTQDGHSFNAFLRDISERAAAEQQLERQRGQLIEAQAVGEFGSWVWELPADLTECSDQLYRIFGLRPGEDAMTFELFLRCVHPDDRSAAEAAVRGAIETCAPLLSDHRIVRPDGTVRLVQVRGEVVQADDGTPLRMLGTVQDVTERRAVERAKDEFTAVVSHELRTPLTSIRGSLGLLESGVLGALPARGQRMVQIAVQNTDRLVRLINDILDIERIDSGQIDMHLQLCDGVELIERAIEGVAQFAVQAGVRVTACGDPVGLVADPDRVLQTLTNLISNAVKFSAAGGVVGVSCARRDDGVLFEVRDEGRGIPADKLGSIFERFAQVDASDSREKGGTGLGLAICRTIVEHHGGRIWVDSELGVGSTFSFVLPAQQADRVAPADGPPADPIELHGDRESAPAPVLGAGDRPFTVLLIEHDPDLAAILAAIFERHAIQTFCAADGREAIELSQQVSPDLLVLDVGPPVTDGFAVVDWLRRHDRFGVLPMVVYTARELDDADRERLRLGSSTEFMTKGRVTPEDLGRHVMRRLAGLPTDRRERSLPIRRAGAVPRS